MEKIDIVIMWVDGSDPAWLEEKNKYSPIKKDYSTSANRFRDWDNLQYLFRGIEKYAPWVNKVFFITWGHLPAWLNTNNPKLRIVKHEEYIPAEYLPTFNSNTIELNLHRIPDLSEHFILFNDDTFILKNTKPSDFFKNGVLCDEFSFNAILPMGEKYRIAHTNVNNTGVINQYFKKNEVLKKNFNKCFNLKYGTNNIRTLLLTPWNCFVGFKNHHLPLPHYKETFRKLWDLEPQLLHDTCINKFRGYNDLNHWLMRYWNLCEGNFEPRSAKFGKYFTVSVTNNGVINYIEKQQGTLICINDMSTDFDFETAKTDINSAFEKILPEKSTFEI